MTAADAQVRSEENARKLGDIRRALASMGDHYLATFNPGTLADENVRGGGQPGSGEPVDLEHVQRRNEAEKDVRYWAHFVLDELDGGPTVSTVHASDVLGCIAFISTWAERIVAHHPEDANTLRKDMTRHSRNLRRIALSLRRKKIAVGDCPELILMGEHGQEEIVRCTGSLYALLNEEAVADEGEADRIDMLPQRVVCDLQADHVWDPIQWRDLGRRVMG